MEIQDAQHKRADRCKMLMSVFQLSQSLPLAIVHVVWKVKGGASLYEVQGFQFEDPFNQQHRYTDTRGMTYACDVDLLQ